jgi:uncharacterized protein (DUF58 family)
MSPEEVTREVRRLEITTRHLVRDIMAGEYSSAFRGRGVEFAEVREYQPGDDVRTIDWNVTARLGSAYVKRYLEERELTVLFVADQSASARFGSVRRTKSDLTTEVCAVLALAAVIFLLSDFLGSGYESALGRLSRRHDLIAIQVVDPRERELPDVGLMTLWDAESGAWRVVDTSDRGLRERFRHRAAEFDARLERTLLESGADLLRLETGASYGEPLLAFFRRRESRLWR